MRDGEDKLVVLSCFRKQLKDVHRDCFEGSKYWNKLEFLLMTVCRIILCATLVSADYGLNICSHRSLV